MKKILMLLGAMALTFGAVSCNNDSKQEDKPDVDNIVEDGFYVVGEAAEMTSLNVKYQLCQGINEVDGAAKDGMYEKYIALRGGKGFSLELKKGSEQIRYSASLEDVALDGSNDQPTITIKKGALVTGDSAPEMKVDADGFYHIVLDLGTSQILVAPVEWGVSGGMNSWGYSVMTCSGFNMTSMTWTITDQMLASGGKFKFKYGNGWKIELDADATVKANTNLGTDCAPGGADIADCEAGGYFTITLTWTLASGSIAKSFSYAVEQTGKVELPTTMYMIGSQFGSWDWASDGIVELAAVNGQVGQFWCIRYFEASTGFKFCSVKDWNGDFASVGTDTGISHDGDGNCIVEEAGVYMVYVDLLNKVLCVEPAVVYAIGDSAGAWDEGIAAAQFTRDEKTMSWTATGTGVLRMYADCSVKTSDWWTREWCNVEGKIVYRGAGDEVYSIYPDASFTIKAGETVTLDFNAGTVTVGGEAQKSDPSVLSVGFSGQTFNGWGDPTGDSLAYYSAADSSISGNVGTVCFKIDSINIPAETFKLRIGTAWIGANEITIEGNGFADDGGNDHNIQCSAAGNYSVKISFDWDGAMYSNIKIVFTAI